MLRLNNKIKNSNEKPHTRPYGSLPSDLLTNIGVFSHPKDLIRLMQTNRVLSRTLRGSSIWKYQLSKLYPYQFEQIKASKEFIDGRIINWHEECKRAHHHNNAILYLDDDYTYTKENVTEKIKYHQYNITSGMLTSAIMMGITILLIYLATVSLFGAMFSMIFAPLSFYVSVKNFIGTISTMLRQRPIIRAMMRLNFSSPAIISNDEQEYQIALSALHDSLRKMTQPNKQNKKLAQAAIDLAVMIDKEKNKPIAPAQLRFDIKFYTQILIKTQELLLKPSQTELRNAYKKLAAQVEGHSSSGKILGGLMLAILGLVICAVFTFTTMAAFGQWSPLNTIGVTVGTTAFIKGLTTTGTIAGLGYTGVGLRLFQSGKHKGLSKKILNFVESTKKMKSDPQAPSFSFFPR